jgi:hypothetical protein
MKLDANEYPPEKNTFYQQKFWKIVNKAKYFFLYLSITYETGHYWIAEKNTAKIQRGNNTRWMPDIPDAK